jgi:hypothetical protein
MHFSPNGPARPCWHRTCFDGLNGAGNAYFARPGCPRGRASPYWGCSAYLREVGADYEDGPQKRQARPGATILSTPR